MSCIYTVLSHVVASNVLAINTAANVQRTSSSTTATPTAPTTSIVSTTTTTTPCSSSTSTTSGSTTGPTTPPSVAAIIVVTTGYNTKDDEDDSQIIQMIDNCFQIFDSIGKTIKNSPRAGGYVSVEFIGHKSFRFSFRETYTGVFADLPKLCTVWCLDFDERSLRIFNE